MLLTCKIEVKATDFPKAGFCSFVNDINDFVEPPKSDKHDIVGHNGKKTFMSYTKITDVTSKQYAIQQDAYTDEEGFRKINNRYCVAIGTAFGVYTGQIFDVTLENGTVIECIVGDTKADKDTDKTNIFTSQGCCLEFIVDTKKICGTMIMKMGDCSYRCDEWNSPCVQFKVYDSNYFEKGEE